MFKVGQKVWCAIYGEGLVERFCDGLYQVHVNFKNGKVILYTSDGYIDVRFGNQTLFHYPVKIVRDKSVSIKPSICWEAVDTKFNYLAVDADGSAYLHGGMPVLWPELSLWRSQCSQRTEGLFKVENLDMCDWKDSLVKRPE